MASRPGPTIRQRRLGSELRRLREDAKVAQREAGEHIDGGQGKLSKIETGRQNVRRLELLALLDLYQVEDQTLRNGLIALLRDSRKKNWWHEFSDTVEPGTLEMIALEDECDGIVQYGNMTIPGLLQTEQYAEALITGLEPQLADDQVRFHVGLRLRRQRILDRTDPPEFACVLDEALLRRHVGGPEVMAGQLSKLLELIRRPKVSIQVVPFERAVHPGVYGSFRALLNSSPAALNVVEMTHWTGTLYMEEEAHVKAYRLLFNEVRSAALSSRQSIGLIQQILRDLRNTDG